MKRWKTYGLFIALSEAVGILSGLLSMDGIREFGESVIKPPLSPPSWVFPIVWTILYALMGIGAARIWLLPASARRERALKLFTVQLIVNFFWSLYFFNGQAYGFAFLWLLLLLGLVAYMTYTYYYIDKRAALLQMPYLIWLLLAAYLNFGVYWLNR